MFTVSSPPFQLEEKLLVPNIEKGRSEKSTTHNWLGGLTMFLVKEDSVKEEYGFEGSILKVVLVLL